MKMIKPTPEQMAAARAVAQWEIGHPDWADIIVSALRDPVGTMARLKADGFER